MKTRRCFALLLALYCVAQRLQNICHCHALLLLALFYRREFCLSSKLGFTWVAFACNFDVTWCFFQRKSAEGGLPLAWECAVKGGILFSKRIPPLYPPREGRGGPPRPPTLRVLFLNDCTRCAVWVQCTWLRHESLRFVTVFNRALLS